MVQIHRCKACGARRTSGDWTECEECGGAVHEPCVDYERAVLCKACADEPWLGAVEF